MIQQRNIKIQYPTFAATSVPILGCERVSIRIASSDLSIVTSGPNSSQYLRTIPKSVDKKLVEVDAGRKSTRCWSIDLRLLPLALQKASTTDCHLSIGRIPLKLTLSTGEYRHTHAHLPGDRCASLTSISASENKRAMCFRVPQIVSASQHIDRGMCLSTTYIRSADRP